MMYEGIMTNSHEILMDILSIGRHAIISKKPIITLLIKS